MMILFALNTLALVGSTSAAAVLLVRLAGAHDLINSGIVAMNETINERRMRSLLKKYRRPAALKLSVAESVELYLIDKSNIRRYIPFMSFKLMLVISIIIFAAVFRPAYKLLYFVPSAAIISFITALVPFFALDLLGRYNSEVIRRRLAEFISILNRWCAVKEDIFYAFERSAESGLGEPLRTFIRDMVIQVNRGIEPAEALDILQLKVDSPQFRDFITNIKQNIRHRGDIRKLLTNLEDQYYKIEEEYNRRRISTYRDRLTIYLVMLGVLAVGYYFFKINPDVRSYYLGTLSGKTLLTAFCLLYAGGFYLSFKVTRFRH